MEKINGEIKSPSLLQFRLLPFYDFPKKFPKGWFRGVDNEVDGDKAALQMPESEPIFLKEIYHGSY
ncbi:hypothetical protein ACP3S8_12700 [Mixta calida]|uniref:hypothetical protein n=1 Tax=Mixta calida TaxID=665913 RepID=UPI00290D1019|nr:hypothetical protein [Pantoea sp.]